MVMSRSPEEPSQPAPPPPAKDLGDVAGGVSPRGQTDLGEGPPAAPSTESASQLGHTRLSGAWTAAAATLVLLVLLLVFILLNLTKVEVNFYGAHLQMPLAVLLLFAVVLGSLLVFGLGAARILQVRMRARRASRTQSGPIQTPPP
jgi:uncharacterized integral membrane protein